ncbi:carbohydrate porin [Roseomonas mucosa]|uniref:carbohydrate porin n=1 Tax=Roseomonas mucosa TaxID=207340 RepID=UPI0028CC0AB3|nr:carbohydrate porin [Roseomonas mucosa]MDT8354010.1 carbohydrate porin [Roseomonas mucosa]
MPPCLPALHRWRASLSRLSLPPILTALFLAGTTAAPARADDAPGQETPGTREPACEDGASLTPGACLEGQVLLDSFANTRGGVHRGVAALGQLSLGTDLDLGTLAGWQGWTARASAYGIVGRQPSPSLIGSLSSLSNAEAVPTFRLSELWVQREVEGIGSLRIGQIAADTEFFTAAAAGSLTNGTFGWPMGISYALPSGGPGYPFAAPGIRLALGDPEGGNGFRAAIMTGDPGGKYGAGTDPQRHNRYGTNFSFAGGTFYIAEGVVGAAAPEDSKQRPWVAKLGAWYHNGGFDDQRGDPGIYFAEPTSTNASVDPLANGGVPRKPNNYGLYTVGEVTLWRGAASNLASFARLSFTPGGRNLLDFYGDAGLAWHGPFGRKDDTASIGLAYAQTGAAGRDLDRALRALTGLPPTRNREMVLEANYEAAVTDHLAIRPGVQWISHPDAGIPDERYRDDARLRDAVVLELRLAAKL